MTTYEYQESLYFGWDAWAESEESLSGSGYFEFSVENSVGVICGIGPDGIFPHYSNIEHGFYIEGTGFRIIESGVPITTSVSFSSSDRFRIKKSGLNVSYYLGGALLLTSVAGYRAPSRLYAAMYGYYDGVLNPVMVEEESSAQADGELPRYVSKAFTDHFSMADGAFAALESEAWANSGAEIDADLPCLVSQAATDDVAFCISTLPRYETSGDAGEDLTPNIVNCASYLPYYRADGHAETPPEIESFMSPMLSFGLCVDAGDVGIDGGLGLGILPAYTSSAGVELTCWMEVDVPKIQFVQFESSPGIYGQAFKIQGQLHAMPTGAQIIGELFDLKGEMVGACSISGLLGELSGSLFSTVSVEAKIQGVIAMLHGGMKGAACLQGALPSILGQISGSAQVSTGIAGRVTSLQGRVDALRATSCKVDGRLFSVHGALLVRREVVGRISGKVLSLAGQASLIQSKSANISGSVGRLRGRMAACPIVTCIINRKIFILYGGISSDSGNLTHLTMRFTRV